MVPYDADTNTIKETGVPHTSWYGEGLGEGGDGRMYFIHGGADS